MKFEKKKLRFVFLTLILFFPPCIFFEDPIQIIAATAAFLGKHKYFEKHEIGHDGRRCSHCAIYLPKVSCTLTNCLLVVSHCPKFFEKHEIGHNGRRCTHCPSLSRLAGEPQLEIWKNTLRQNEKHALISLFFIFCFSLKFNYSGCDGAPGGVSVLVFVQIGGEV